MIGSPFKTAARLIPSLLPYICFALAVQIGIEHEVYSHPLSREQTGLLLILYACTDTWLSSIVFLGVLNQNRESPAPTLSTFAKLALSVLPKPFLTYFLIIMFFDVYRAIPPLAILLVLVIWAPFFAVADCITPDSEEDEEEDWTEPSSKINGGLFTGRAIWELGFGRSMRFSTIHLPVAIGVGLMYWAAEVLPRAVLAFAGAEEWGFTGELARIVIVTFCNTYVLAVGAGLFLSRVSAVGRNELNLPPVSQVVQTHISRITLYTLSLFGVITISATYFLHRTELANSHFPSSATTSINSLLSVEREVIASVTVTDTKDQFRWFIPEMIRLKTSSGTKLLPNRIVVSSDDSPNEQLRGYRPWGKPLRIELTFKPEQIPAVGEILGLIYLGADGNETEIASGTLKLYREGEGGTP